MAKYASEFELMYALANMIRDEYVNESGDKLSPQQCAEIAHRCRERGVDPRYTERGICLLAPHWLIVEKVVEESRARRRS